MTVKLTQWLCPERHCILAVLWDELESEYFEVLKDGEAMFIDKGGSINRWCGICGQPVDPPETGITRFRTVEEGLDPMRALQRDNAIARDILGGHF